MTIFGRGHVRETALAGLADDPDASRRLSASDRAHLEACERCRRLLEGHRRAARLLASSWQYVSSEQMAVGSGVQRVHGRVAALPAHRPIALSWQAVVLLLLLLVAVAGMGLLVGTSPRPSTLLAPQPFEPQFLAIDAEGRIYASDCLSNLIVRVDAGGASVIAGSGAARMSPGYSGDGGPATSARLNCPFGLAFDTAGNLLFADASNDRVRRIDPSGTITTLVGSGARGQASAYGGDGGPAADALLRAPIGIAFDAAGNLYIADRDNDRVRKVDTRGIITTIAGDGRSGYSGDGGPATEASLDDPSDIAIDASGNVLFADSNNGRIRLIDPQDASPRSPARASVSRQATVGRRTRRRSSTPRKSSWMAPGTCTSPRPATTASVGSTAAGSSPPSLVPERQGSGGRRPGHAGLAVRRPGARHRQPGERVHRRPG